MTSPPCPCPATTLKRLGIILATGLLTACTVYGSARAQESSTTPTPQAYPEEVMDSLRQGLLAIPMTALSGARISDRGLEVFRAAAERRLATIPIESLVQVQINMQLPLPGGAGQQADAGEAQEVSGNLTILFNFGEIGTWVSAVCADALPQVSATDQIQARPICQQYSQFATMTQP